MECPRCRTENGDAAIRCSGCGAPIALGDEVAGGPVDSPLPLDRRSARREGTAAWEGPRPVPLDWEMAPPAEGAARSARAPTRAAPRPRPRPAAAPAQEFELDMEVGSVEVHRVRAPAWRRALSWGVDGVLLGALLAALLAPVLGPAIGPGWLAALGEGRGLLVPSLLVVALFGFAYGWLGVALAGATPGLLATGLRVVGPDGNRPSPGRAAVRSALALAAAAPLGAGIFVSLLTRSGQGLHDLGARTWVVLAIRRGRTA
ncbi:MAG TPA: RDD family protein [Anaeromyxobacteraceae bacterium]|nr:RDD family protein [Anaeromyxobacteraceae bacterium]